MLLQFPELERADGVWLCAFNKRGIAMSRSLTVILLIIVVAIGGYFIWRDQHKDTTTLKLPGDNKVTLEHDKPL